VWGVVCVFVCVCVCVGVCVNWQKNIENASSMFAKVLTDGIVKEKQSAQAD